MPSLFGFILASLVYFTALVIFAIGYGQYVKHVGRVWWLPWILFFLGIGSLAVWQYLLDMPFESLPLFLRIAQVFYALSGFGFVAFSLIGWRCWWRTRKKRGSN